MTNFALYAAGNWMDGEAPKLRTKIFVVSYDSKNIAYSVDITDYDDFMFWVACTFESSDKPFDCDWEPQEYFDMIGLKVSEYNA